MKKILRILIIIIIVITSIIFYISSIINSNQDQLEKTINIISKKYKTEEKIIDINQYGEYTILTTNKNVIVIDKSYKEIKKEELSKLKKMPSDYKFIYKKDKIIYEKTTLKNSKLIYKYYDAITGEKINSTIMEMK